MKSLWVRIAWGRGVTTVLPLHDYCRLPMAAVLRQRATLITGEEAIRERRRGYIVARAGRMVS